MENLDLNNTQNMDLGSESEIKLMKYPMYDINYGANAYSNFISYPIYLVKAKKPVTIINGANQTMNISVGQIGTFQQVVGAPSPTQNVYLVEITFGGNKIRVQFNSTPNNPNAVRELILKNNEYDIISVSSDSKKQIKNYSNIDAQPMIDLGVDASSNAIGCGLPPVCSLTKLQTGTTQKCTKIFGKNVCINVPTVKTVPNQACINQHNAHNACVAQQGHLGQNIIKDVNKVVKKIQDKAGSIGKDFRNNFRRVMRQIILLKIKDNIHGIATRLYPAVGSASDVTAKKYKPTFIANSKATYPEVLQKWVDLGGNKSDLDNAITAGSTKRFLKSPYSSVNGNESYGFVYQYNNAEGDPPADSGYADETLSTGDTSGTSTDTSGTGTSADSGVLNEQTGQQEVPDKTETKKGVMAFFAWILALFKKKKVDQNPYQDGTTPSTQFQVAAAADTSNQPNPNEIYNPVATQIDTTKVADDVNGAGNKYKDATTDTILGLSSGTFWLIAGSIVAVFVGYKIITKK
ncbi:MAG TPA: hypothetical protein VN026_15985 [Bacteroidia bacterium]|jgi:hypothetical protein|nr:hypothetical protein [Bacteroidia bacterium]